MKVKSQEEIAQDFIRKRNDRFNKGLFVGLSAFFIGAQFASRKDLQEVNARRENNGKGLSVNQFAP